MVELFDYQREALSELKSGSILCGRTGSGKSLTAVAWYFKNNCDNESCKDLYIITTAKKRDDFEWDKELRFFFLSRDTDKSCTSAKIVVDSWNNIKKYQEVKNAVFIFDEQRLVTYGTWTKTFLKIARNNEWILLTATPGDTWIEYAPVMIANGYYKNKTDFELQHVVYNRFSKYPLIDRYINVKKLEQIRDDILVVMDYDRKTEVNYIFVNTIFDKDKYRRVEKDRWDIYKDEPVTNASQYCYILRRICNSDPSRLMALDQEFKNHKRVIIFYNFTYELEALRLWCKNNGINYGEWNGEKHTGIPKDKEEWVYLVQYNAGSEGWNCTDTDTIFFYSQSYSYKQMKQAAGRIDRVNTKFKTLNYYIFTTESSIDRTLRKCLKTKKKFNETIFMDRGESIG